MHANLILNDLQYKCTLVPVTSCLSVVSQLTCSLISFWSHIMPLFILSYSQKFRLVASRPFMPKYVDNRGTVHGYLLLKWISALLITVLWGNIHAFVHIYFIAVLYVCDKLSKSAIVKTGCCHFRLCGLISFKDLWSVVNNFLIHMCIGQCAFVSFSDTFVCIILTTSLLFYILWLHLYKQTFLYRDLMLIMN